MEQFETFSPAERAYFESKGEKPIDAMTEDVSEPDTEDEAGEVEAVEPEEADEAEAPEAKADEPKDETPEEKPRKDQRIPLRKLQESEKQRRELEARLAEREQAFARADERLKTLLALANPPEQPKEVAPPNPQDDPIGAIEYQRQRLEQMEAERQQQMRAYQEQEQVRALDTSYRQSWQSFANEKPDAIEAYNHFVSVTGQFLALQGVPEQQVNQLIENEERKIAVAAMQRGVSPAELIYESAKRMGYAPKAAVSEPDHTAAKKAEEDVARRQKAAPASRSLSSTGGSRSGNIPTAEELANMSEDEFQTVVGKLSPRQKQQIFGG